jgi:hypothetical protein
MALPLLGRASPGTSPAPVGTGLGLVLASAFGLALTLQVPSSIPAYAETAGSVASARSALKLSGVTTITNPGSPVGPGVKKPPQLQLSIPATTDSRGKLIAPEQKLTIELPSTPATSATGVTADIPLSIGIQGKGSIKSAHVPSTTDRSAPPDLLTLGPNSVLTPARGMIVTITPDQQPAAPPMPVTPASFLDLDSGLTDCQIPFEALTARSPSCQNTVSFAGRRCEQYSPSQFPEVVAINTGSQLCSGTLISKTWVVSAAHCFGGDAPASSQVQLRNGDWTIPPAALAQIRVHGSNAVTLPNEADRIRGVVKVVGYRDYGGKNSTPPYMGDVALVELSSPFPESAVQPALLAQRKDFEQAVTLAGFGFSNADGGTFDQFNVTWPDSISKPTSEGQTTFNPLAEKTGKSAFCEGDSGGPVFSGRYRGCKASDRPPERRPRLLEALISYRGAGDAGMGNFNTVHANSCMNASLMAMQDLTNTATRKFICTTTSNAAGNCK